MPPDETVPAGLRRTLDGHDVGRGFGDDCPSCGQDYSAGERLVVRSERPSGTADWDVSAVVCAECGRRSIAADERRDGVDQALVSVEVATAPMALVLDGDSARMLDRRPGDGD